ncbi:MAG: GGDEF domain-containing protein [Deltaproteobacteria bacterium]|nr:GGDEF domain-containing protein [Deltaproteobacteria bacterium]
MAIRHAFGTTDRLEPLEEATAVIQAMSPTIENLLARASDSPPSLLLLQGPAHRMGELWKLDRAVVQVGRAPAADIYLDDRSLSKLHLAIHQFGDEVRVVDLASTNRTLVNGLALKPHEAVPLKDNDQIKAGNVLLKFLAAGSVEAVAAQEMLDRLRLDSLTGTFNKGALLARVPDLLLRARLNDWPLGVSVLDLDHFKKVNDTWGHDAGDHVLKEMAGLLRSLARPQDFVARFGGEEFVMLHEQTHQAAVAEVGERVRAAVQAHDFSFKGQAIALTVSIGAAMVTPDCGDWDSLFKQADQALYRSKHGGRNRVTFAEAANPPPG